MTASRTEPMTEAEFLDQVDSWALGGLSADERAAMERFVEDHPTPRVLDAQRRAFATAALLAAALPPAPPAPQAWDRIAAALPRRSNGVGVTPRRSRARAWAIAGWAVAAAAVLLLIWTWRDRRPAEIARPDDQAERDRQLAAAAALAPALDDCRRDLDAMRARDKLAADAVALLELPGTQLIPLEHEPVAPTGLAANAIYHRGVKKAYVVAAGLPATAPAGTYQVWLTRGGQRVAAGELVPGVDGRAIATVPTLSLDDGVPETFQVTLATGELLLESKVRI